MKISADKEGINAIRDLINVALKAGGISNLQFSVNVLNCITEIPESDKIDK